MEGSNICVAIEENGDVTFQAEDSNVSNDDLLNAVNEFAAEYRTNTQGSLQEIEDLKLSNKKQSQALEEVGGKGVDKYASARSIGHATNDLSENADNKERRKLSSAKPTRSTVATTPPQANGDAKLATQSSKCRTKASSFPTTT